MSWKSLGKAFSSGMNGLGNWMGSSIPALGQYLGDFKDWYDGTAAMRKQNQMNIDNWNMVNAYNTPSAQMQRFAEAGLNPNLIYSQQNTAGQIASASMPDSGSQQLGRAASTVAAMYGMKQAAANIANLRQQNENLKSQDTLLNTQADYLSAETDRYKYETAVMKERGMISQDASDYRLYRSVKGDVKEVWDAAKKWYNDNVGSSSAYDDYLRSELLRSGYKEIVYESGRREYVRP